MKFPSFQRLKIIPVLGFSAAVLSCSNTKDTLVNRTFHNLSAHYNGYYNAGLKLEEATDKLAAAHTDHYDRILSVFQYADVAKSKTIYPQLEDAMKRTSTVISRHTILDNRGYEKPQSEKWIDDNWLLYGKCQFFKHDYFEAMETFNYVEMTYKSDPGRHLGSLWIAKTYIELTQMREAEEKLDYLRNQPDFPKKHKWELEAVNADYYLQTRNYDKGAEHLTRAAALVKDRDKKIRYLYILAQIHQQKANFKQAFDLYTKVIKMNPPYEMAFNARLSRARCYDSSSSGSGQSVLKELLQMEKDPKNKDFLDQIYYALAGLKKNEGNQEEEIKYLNLSVRSSTGNQNQKALAYLELAKIAFAKPDYRLAQSYYDSTITSLGKDYPDYTEILTRRNSLTKLIKYLKTIETEDSLQQLSKLSREEQVKKVEGIIREEEDKKKVAEAKARANANDQANQIFDPSRQAEANQFNKATGAAWYFYNLQAVSFGFNEFKKKFGERKLEDNWRRSKKQSSVADLNELEPKGPEDSAKSDTSALSPDKMKEEMLKGIPSSPEALEKSAGKIVDAYYNAGMIYREQLSDLKASVETFEELISRYPQNKFLLQTYYQLYRTYALMGNTAKADYYKNIILNQYGSSEYAEIIRNPNYGAERANRKSNLDIFYEDTYRKYLNGEYAEVISRKSQSDAQFPQNPYVPKFDLLKTLSIGKTQPLPVFEASLNDIIRNYSNDSVKDMAQSILDYMHGKNSEKPAPPETMKDTATKPDADVRLYKYLPDTLHDVVLLMQNINGPLDPNKIKNKLSNFNTANYASKGITFQDILYDHRLKIFIIREFANKDDAMQYVNFLFDNDDVFGNISNEAYELYAISVNNLSAFLKEKKTEDYQDFFRKFYK